MCKYIQRNGLRVYTVASVDVHGIIASDILRSTPREEGVRAVARLGIVLGGAVSSSLAKRGLQLAVASGREGVTSHIWRRTRGANRPPSPDSYTDSNSLEEVEASLNDLDDEIDDTQNAVSQWSSSYTGSPSFVSLPSFAGSPPPQHPATRLSRITERTEEASSRPSSTAVRRSALPFPASPSMHSRASTEPGLPPPGRATELIAVFEAAPVRASTPTHSRAASSPAPGFFTPAQSVAPDSYAQGFHSTFGSRPASPTKGARVTSPPTTTPLSPGRTRPSMSTLLSQPPISSGRTSPSGYTSATPSTGFTRSETFTRTDTRNYYAYNYYSNTHYADYSHYAYSHPISIRHHRAHAARIVAPPAQGSPRSPLASVRNIVALWKERTPTRAGAGGSPKDSSSSSSSSSSKSAEKKSVEKKSDKSKSSDEHPLPALPIPTQESDLFALRARTPSLRRLAEDASSLRRAASGSRASGNGSGSLRRSVGSGAGAGALPPALNVAELSAYAQSNEAPLHIGLLWFLNVHAPPPYRWQRCQALLYPHLLLLSWLAPGGGRGIVGLDLINCQSVQSTPSLGHPAAREDVGSVAARAQAEGEVDTLVDLLVPFQMVYEDGVERLAAESLLERQKWVNRIWEAVHRPLTLAESSAGSSAGDADESANESASVTRSVDSRGMPARTASIRTILSIESASSAASNGSDRSNGSRSTVFVPPLGELEDIESESGTDERSRWTRTFTPTTGWTGTYTARKPARAAMHPTRSVLVCLRYPSRGITPRDSWCARMDPRRVRTPQVETASSECPQRAMHLQACAENPAESACTPIVDSRAWTLEVHSAQKLSDEKDRAYRSSGLTQKDLFLVLKIIGSWGFN
ncbi:hypothetical protein B0H13DRAFT_1904662 [Mycena leptocephala]|nr:hypothetical protein B0H13DRAFT_1904662 [Mycena leptocephala]